MLSKHEISVIYAQGVEGVEATIRQLYEMIEVEEDRVQRLIACATSTHLKKIEQLSLRLNRLEAELSNRIGQVHQLNRTIKELSKELRESRQQTLLARQAHLAHLLKNSQNSSRPPSTDLHKRTKSLREKSGKKVGGQPGHRGTTLGLVVKADRLVIHAPEECALCGSDLRGSDVTGSERRQVHDLPLQKIEVTEHQVQTKVCGRCGTKNKAQFPTGVNAPVQYGERVRSVGAYLMGYQLLPYERCAEALADLFDCQLSPGTLATLLKECAGELIGAELLIKEGLRKSAVIGVDETNLRVSKRQDWVHVSSTEKLTLLVHDTRRGAPAISEIDILPRYKGVAMHDGFSSYDQYGQCRHAQCNAHILRELNYVIETGKPEWATEMKALLLEIKAAVGTAREGGRKKLGACQKKEFLEKYDQVIAEAQKLYGTLRRKRGRSKRPKVVESPLLAAARKLACRLRDKKEQILLFMTEFRVPFDNNQAERDLRMLKVKQKISGCFRTDKGAEEWCRLRSYISTMKKQGRDVMETIKSVYADKSMMPALQ